MRDRSRLSNQAYEDTAAALEQDGWLRRTVPAPFGGKVEVFVADGQFMILQRPPRSLHWSLHPVPFPIPLTA